MHLFAEERPRLITGGTAKRTPLGEAGIGMVETFGRALRRLREQADLSQPELARRVPISQSSLSRYESDQQQCEPTTADRLDGLLGADGALRALLAPVNAALTVLNPDDRDRLTYVSERPRAVDSGALGSLAVVLAESRHLEDRLGAGIVLEPALGHMRLLERLTLDAHGPIRPHVVDLAGQWAQFTGWLYAATGKFPTSGRWFDRALEWSIEADNAALQANAFSHKGNLARMSGHIGSMIGLSQAAQRNKGIWVGQLAFAAAQEARGHSVMGDRRQANHLLDVAEQCAEQIPLLITEAPPWNYDTKALINLERAVIQHHLGHNQIAADLLTESIQALPAEHQIADWVEDYRRVLAEVKAEL